MNTHRQPQNITSLADLIILKIKWNWKIFGPSFFIHAVVLECDSVPLYANTDTVVVAWP